MNIPTKDKILVSIQFLLLVGYLWPIEAFGRFSIPIWVSQIALFIGVLGLGIVILAILQLNSNLTPFPSPKTNSSLIQHGLYSYVRHPIYSGILFFVWGWGLYQTNLWQLFISIVLTLFFYFKSDYEESLLTNKFPDYQHYKRQAGRFLPRFFSRK